MESLGKKPCRKGVIVCFLLALTGCPDPEITSYRVPKDPGATAASVPVEPGVAAPLAPQRETPPVSVAQGGAKPAENTNDLPPAPFKIAPAGAADEPSLRWQAPPEWAAQPITAMRKGSFAVSRGGVTADLSITAFPGDVGGLEANVNRWRAQIGLPPLGGAALGASTETLDANGLHFTLVDFAGPTPGGQQRILAALASWRGATWFFKLMGPEGLVESEKPDFTAFLKTVGSK